MKRINILCALLLGLLTSINANAGVTDGDVTAYVPYFGYPGATPNGVGFTDNPSEAPNSFNYPLGTGTLAAQSRNCRRLLRDCPPWKNGH